MCLYPRLILNRKYTQTKKNGGDIPVVLDRRALAVPKACEKCIECRKQKKREWQVRLMEEIKDRNDGKFITLTFNTESLKELSKGIDLKGYELDNYIATKGVNRWCERWRKHYKKFPRHWLVTELGHKNTEHVHLHGIIWTPANYETIRKTWQYGYIYPRNEREQKQNFVNAKTVNYCIKYVSKMDVLHKEYKPVILSSKGMGAGYITKERYLNNKYKGLDTKEYYRTESGYKIALPIYYRNKIYNDDEKEKLWLNRLDKEERYVGGEKVNIKKGMSEYFNLLEWYRTMNRTIGYGTDDINWNRRKYEHERRILIQNYRLNTNKDVETEIKVKKGVTGYTLRRDGSLLSGVEIEQTERIDRNTLSNAEKGPAHRVGGDLPETGQICQHTPFSAKQRKGPSVGCERLHNILTIIDYGMWKKEELMWKSKFGTGYIRNVYL